MDRVAAGGYCAGYPQGFGVRSNPDPVAPGPVTLDKPRDFSVSRPPNLKSKDIDEFSVCELDLSWSGADCGH